jgi:hypothetical protein
MMRLLLFLLLSCALLLPVFQARAQDSLLLHYRYVPSYIPDLPRKREMNGLYRNDLIALRDQIMATNQQGHELPCSSQILEEARWLMNSTGDKAGVERRLADLRASLKRQDQSFAFEQQKQDGGWGACFNAWYLKLHASVDPLKELVHAGKTPTYPFRLLDLVNTPDKLRNMLRAMLISDLTTGGNDHRKELNLTVTALAQLLYLPGLEKVLPADLPREELAAALRDFTDNVWQDPDTGFWGAWYKVDGQIRRTNDLSITFHVISYRQDSPPRMGRMADTLFAIRTHRYPYGWRDQGTQNNHHAYDVVRLLRRAWPELTQEQRRRSEAELAIMLARSLGVSIDDGARFVDEPYNSVAEAYYFGVSFLDEIGFFRKSRRFWTPLQVTDANSLRQVLLTNIAKLDQTNPMAAAAVRKLQAQD